MSILTGIILGIILTPIFIYLWDRGDVAEARRYVALANQHRTPFPEPLSREELGALNQQGKQRFIQAGEAEIQAHSVVLRTKGFDEQAIAETELIARDQLDTDARRRYGGWFEKFPL